MDRKNAIDPNLAVAYVLESPVSAAVIESTGVYFGTGLQGLRWDPGAVVDKLLATTKIRENGSHRYSMLIRLGITLQVCCNFG